MNVPKDDDTYRIADEPNEAMFIINEATSKSADFRALITEADYKTIYDLEYANPENEAWAYDSLNTLIRFVKENNDEPFKTGIDTYLDVDSAIDYLLALYCLGLSDNYSKNMMFWTFDGKRWIINLYDLDTAFGLAADGSRFYAPEEYLPKLRDDGTVDSGSNNLLWKRLFTIYKDKILQRYQILREDVFSNEHMKEVLRDYLSDIPQTCYKKEREVWPETPLANKNHLAQMETYIDAHLAALDAVMAKIGGTT